MTRPCSELIIIDRAFFLQRGIDGNFCVALARILEIIFQAITRGFYADSRLDDAHLRPCRNEETKWQVTRRLTSVKELATDDNGAPETITSSNCLARRPIGIIDSLLSQQANQMSTSTHKFSQIFWSSHKFQTDIRNFTTFLRISFYARTALQILHTNVPDHVFELWVSFVHCFKVLVTKN